MKSCKALPLRLLAAALCLLMILLTGCGKGNTTGTDGQALPSEQTQPAAEGTTSADGQTQPANEGTTGADGQTVPGEQAQSVGETAAGVGDDGEGEGRWVCVEQRSCDPSGKITVRRSFSTDEAGNYTGQVVYDENEEPSARFIFVCDADGNLTELTYIVIGEDGAEHINYISRSAYDANGNETESTHCIVDEAGREVLTRGTQRDYDADGKTLEEREYDKDTQGFCKARTWEYNDQGNEIKQTDFDPRGNVTAIHVSVYDEQGNRIENRTIREDGTVSEKEVFENEYDAADRLVRVTRCSVKDTERSESVMVEYTYDEAGNKALETWYDDEGRISSKTTYDAAGNELTEIGYDSDGNEDLKLIYTYDANGNGTKLHKYFGGIDRGWVEFDYKFFP